MKQDKVQDYLKKYESAPKSVEQDYFKLAICDTLLDNYPKAKDYFCESVPILLVPNPFWRASSQVNWLVDITIMSGKTEIFPSVVRELNLYRITPSRSGPVGTSPMAHYCYSVMEILLPGSGDINGWIKDLKKRPKYKDLYAAGFALQAILDRNQEAFTQALQAFLKAHEGMAKYGGLRYTSEGWLCLPAMSLSYAAHQKGLKVEVENEYLSMGYLAYLLGID